jgi:DNA mismatch repair protein MSH6
MLLEDFRNVTPCYHMSFKKDLQNEHKIQFLYKFVRGECPSSFGLNIALMAGLPAKVIEIAKKQSDNFIG